MITPSVNPKDEPSNIQVIMVLGCVYIIHTHIYNIRVIVIIIK